MTAQVPGGGALKEVDMRRDSKYASDTFEKELPQWGGKCHRLR